MKPWPKVRLGEVLRRSEETIEPQADVEYREITVRMWGKGVVERGRIMGASLPGRRFVAHAGQFIASRIDARNGAMGLVPESLDGALVTNDFPLFNLNTERLAPAFLGWLCRTAGFVELCTQASEGTTNRIRLKSDGFNALEIPLPPLAEQRRVVARIEELAAQIHEARTLRHQAAEEAGVLLGNKRRQCFAFGSGGKSIPLEQACEAILDTIHSDPIYADEGIACVRSPDIAGEVLNLARALKTSQSEYERRTVRGEPREGDIVYCRQGGGTGRAAIVSKGDRFSLGQAMMLLRPERKAIEPRYFLHQLLSPNIVEDQLEACFIGTASPRVNIGALRKFNLVLPPLAEQRRIVAELDALQAEVDALKRLQAETAAELAALLPALLDRAFKGEL